MAWYYVLAFMNMMLSLYTVSCHPQCLTGGPPMYIGAELQLCKEHTVIGCCRPWEETPVISLYNKLKNKIPRDLWSKCSHFVRDFVCQTCSPYAAHLFDLKHKHDASSYIPGLCSTYCGSFFETCVDLLPFLTQNRPHTSKVIKESKRGVTQFCKLVAPADISYCYPQIQNDTAMNADIKLMQKTVPGCLCVEEVASLLKSPLIVVSAGDGSKRLFIGEQLGVVRILFPNGTLSKSPFMSLQSKIKIGKNTYSDERGFLGMAFHPQYKENGRIFVVYTRKPGRLLIVQLSEFRVSSSDPNKADMTSEKRIMSIPTPFSNHNGGQIFFGTDNYLFLFMGDGGYKDDPFQAGQDLSNLYGKVIRIDVDKTEGRLKYAIPPDNPSFDIPPRRRRREIYAYGLRNPWRCGMDPGDPKTGYGRGRICCGDVGQSAYEEINLIESGKNYGWSGYEGPKCFNKRPYACEKAAKDPNLVFPIFAYNHTVGKCIIGGNFYRGSRSPRLNGFFFYADIATGRLYRLKENQSTGKWENKEMTMCGEDICQAPLQNFYHRSILSFGQDGDGEVYILSTGNRNHNVKAGSVYRIVDPSDITSKRKKKKT